MKNKTHQRERWRDQARDVGRDDRPDNRVTVHTPARQPTRRPAQHMRRDDQRDDRRDENVTVLIIFLNKHSHRSLIKKNCERQLCVPRVHFKNDNYNELLTT